METIGGVLGLIIAGTNIMLIGAAYFAFFIARFKSKRLGQLKKQNQNHATLYQKTFRKE